MRQEIVEKRREDVKSLMLSRMSIRKIAKQLGWDFNTVRADILSIRNEYRSKDLGEDDILTDWLMRNEQQYQNALRIFISTQDEDIKLRANNQMKELDRERLTTCQEFGITQKNLGKIDIREIKVSFASNPKELEEMEG